MTCVSITKAAKLAGVSRNTFYKNYLNRGVVTVSKDEAGRKCVDTSELLRVFGKLQGDSLGLQSDSSESDKRLQGVTVENTASEVEIRLLREQLVKSELREQWLQQKIDTLSDTLKLLEHGEEVKKSARRWWQTLWW